MIMWQWGDYILPNKICAAVSLLYVGLQICKRQTVIKAFPNCLNILSRPLFVSMLSRSTLL